MNKHGAIAQIWVESFTYGMTGAQDRQNYIRALRCEMASAADYANEYFLESVYVSGQNPLLYRGEMIADLVTTLDNIIEIKKGADITIQALPGSVNYGDLLFMRDNGVTRISFDMQTFIQSELNSLGRTYAPSAIEVFTKMVRQKITFFDFDLQLRYGLPGQTVESFQNSLEQAMQLQPTHITILPYRENHGLDLSTFYSIAISEIADSNMAQYTPIHFARPGYECRYNQTIYANLPRMEFGAGGCWKVDGMRCRNTADVGDYVAAEGIPERMIIDTAPITSIDLELVYLKDNLFNLHNCELESVSLESQAKVHPLIEAGFIQCDHGKARLTTKGMINWHTVIATLE
jgi:oxygen-independent coproporphyrinogen III oxidase